MYGNMNLRLAISVKKTMTPKEDEKNLYGNNDGFQLPV